MGYLHDVLTVLYQHSLFVKKLKYMFVVPKIDYLGHIIYEEGVKVDPSKLHSILDWPRPKNVKFLREVFRLIGY